MRRARALLKTIFVVLHLGIFFASGSPAFAEKGEITGEIKDHKSDLAIQWATVSVRDVTTGKVIATGVTDKSGAYSVSISALGNYSVEAAKRGYGYYTAMAPDMVEISDTIPKQTVNLTLGGEEWPPYNPDDQKSAMSWETGVGKSYLIPALEIPSFLVLLNVYDRYAYSDLEENGKKVYDSDFQTFWDHVTDGPWGVDSDAFNINQFAHPYQGSMYHGFARSAGLNYWESLVYTNLGSFLWETAGETTDPSINDQFASGIGGSFFGEALFRMAGLVLEGDGGKPGVWQELGAAIISPPTGINRYAFGNRFMPVFPSHNPATFSRVQLGVNLNGNVSESDSALSSYATTEGSLSYTMAYGLPGKPGYDYSRPFDYFHFELTTLGNTDNPVDNIMIRGYLLGDAYQLGNAYCGIWGLYGGYDYISPHIFRVSSTSLSLGTTYQWWLSRAVALQGSVLGGVGYAAAGNVSQVGERDYHYGVAPQGLVGLRLIMSDRAMLDLTGRTYHLTGMGGNDPGGREIIDRLDTGFTVRVTGQHALGLKYIASIRDAHYPDRPDSHQSAGTVSLVYTWLGKARFGAVEWRGADYL
ncbi:MAG: DUF3943 domain-containing protein [Desulfobulbaceae bacterium]|nr:DUF3943 domain-containing protein [Desulfobulbaceae bacterium]